MKFKILSLLLSSGLVLAACNADNANDKQKGPDDNAKSEVNSSETNKSDDVKENDNNTAKDSDDNDQDNSPDATKDDDDKDDDNDTSDGQSIAFKDITATPDDIIKLVQDKHPDGELTAIKFEEDNGEWIYKVAQNEKDKNVEYKYSMKDKKEISSEQDQIDKEDMKIDYDKVKPFDEVIKKVQEQAKDAQIKEWSLDTDDGMLVYDIEVMDGNKERTFKVDPFKGLVNEK